MELKELIGLHKLTGVTNEALSLEQEWDKTQIYDAQTISFILDGVTYTAVEDSNDGYRSAMRELFVNKFLCKNKFKAVKVFCIYFDKNRYESCDILQVYSVATGKLILHIGTENTDDYYPSFASLWQPENIA